MLKKALACAAILLFGTCFMRLNNAQGADFEKGKAFYQERCALCHGLKGDGKSHAATTLHLELQDFTKAKFWEAANIEHKMAEAIKAGIKGKMKGNPDPVLTRLLHKNDDISSDDIESIVLYMAQTFKPKATSKTEQK